MKNNDWLVDIFRNQAKELVQPDTEYYDIQEMMRLFNQSLFEQVILNTLVMFGILEITKDIEIGYWDEYDGDVYRCDVLEYVHFNDEQKTLISFDKGNEKYQEFLKNDDLMLTDLGDNGFAGEFGLTIENNSDITLYNGIIVRFVVIEDEDENK